MPNPYTTTYDEIKAIADGLGVNFAYGRKSEINIQGDNEIFPAIVLIEPDDIGFDIFVTPGTIKDYDNCFIQFIDQIVMGEQADYRHPTVIAMRTLGSKFVEQVIESQNIELIMNGAISRIRGVLVVDTYDVNVAGIEINLSLRLTYPRDCNV